MPIYEYISRNAEKGCRLCRRPFETIQGVCEAPLGSCPECGEPVKKLISRCRAAVIEYDENYAAVENRIRDHEREGRWSHAAELADTYSSKTADSGLKTRAIENYAKAGYSPPSLDSRDSEE